MKAGAKKLIDMFLIFLKIGAFTFGGGYAMIPLIQREVVERRHYIDEDEMVDIIAIAESTPGPVAINSATFVGYKNGGVAGAAVCTLGIVVPSFVIILIISYFYKQFAALEYVGYAFFGIRAGVLALLLKALYSVFKKQKKTPVAYFIMAGAFVAAAVLKLNVLLVIAASAAVGFTSWLIAEGTGKKA